MSSQHRIDPSRLSVLKSQREIVFAAASKAGETIRNLSAARSRLASEISRVTYEASQNIGWIDQGDRQKRIDELNAEIEKIEAEIKHAKAEQEPLAERSQAIGRLYASCAGFMGVDPHGR